MATKPKSKPKSKPMIATDRAMAALIKNNPGMYTAVKIRATKKKRSK